MSMDAKEPASTTPALKHREKGIRIFTWPKVIYIFPSAIVSLICAIGMWTLKNETHDPTKPMPGAAQAAPATTTAPTETTAAETGQGPMSKRERFSTPQNLLGVL